MDAGVEIAESVNEAGGEEVLDTLAFFGGEAGVMFVVFGAGKVKRGVGGVKIAADDNGFVGVKQLEEAEQGGVPELFAELEAGEVAFAVGDVNVDEVEGLELKGLDAAFGEQVAVAVGLPVVGLDDGVGETVMDGEGLELGENGGAGVAGTVGAVPELKIFGEIQLGLAGLGFGFLEAEQVGVGGV